MGDHLRAAGMRSDLVGKTHMTADAEGMERLGLAPDSVIGVRVSECGFDLFERDDGMRPQGPDGFYDGDREFAYDTYLRDRGYDSDNPWHDFANSALDKDGNVKSGWFLKNSPLAANIHEYDSETPYLTRRGIDYMAQAEGPWCCHLSYIKPHWPYIVPDPYASMYGPQHVLPPVRSQDEYDNAHPVQRAFMDSLVGKTFSREEVRNAVIPAYMGLIKQADDQMGVLFEWMEKNGRMDDTMIVLTSDHGDFLGDHWMGEKTFFQDASTRIPLIIYDPSPEADATRGTVSDALVESIDLAPTFVDLAGAEPKEQYLEGHSLRPILHGTATETPREFVICEYDIAPTATGQKMGCTTKDGFLFMLADKKWKLIHAECSDQPILFDLENDPDELVDLGQSPAHQDIIDTLYQKLSRWSRRPSQRTTLSKDTLMAMRAGSTRKGVVIGAFDESDIAAESIQNYVGRRARPFRDVTKPSAEGD